MSKRPAGRRSRDRLPAPMMTAEKGTNEMNKNKENAVNDYIEMVRRSWTFGKMTDDEKSRCIDVLTDVTVFNIQGTYIQRWNALHAVYNAFLVGIGYNSFNWRESA